MTWWDILLVALSTRAILDVWLDGEIFASWRSGLEAREDLVSRALTCRFCLSHHVVFLHFALYAANYLLASSVTAARTAASVLAAIAVVTILDEILRKDEY